MKKHIRQFVLLSWMLCMIGCASVVLRLPKEEAAALTAAVAVKEKPENRFDLSDLCPVPTDLGRFHMVQNDEVYALSFRTNAGEEQLIANGFFTNLQWRAPYLYATRDIDPYTIPQLYRFDFSARAVDRFPQDTQQYFVFDDGSLLWYSLADRCYYRSDWAAKEKQVLLAETEMLPLLSDGDTLYLVGATVYRAAGGAAFEPIVSLSDADAYVQGAFWADGQMYLLLGNINRQIAQLVRVTDDEQLETVGTITGEFYINLGSATKAILTRAEREAWDAWGQKSVYYEMDIDENHTLIVLNPMESSGIYRFEDRIIYSYYEYNRWRESEIMLP